MLKTAKKFLLCITCIFGITCGITAAHATLPSEYTELEYIQSTGTQYIDTGYHTTTDTWVHTDIMSFASGNKIWFGGYGNRGATTAFAFNQANDTAFNYIYSSSPWTNISQDNMYGTKFSIDFAKNKKVYVDGVQKSDMSSYTKSYDSGNLLLFARPNFATNQYMMIGRMYDFVIYEDNTVVMNLVPAKRNSDNAIGMYDTVTDTFYASATSSPFTAGPVVITGPSINYVMDGGTNYNNAPITYVEGTGTTIDGTPTKAGYVFVGWCTDSGLTSCALTQTIGTDATGDKTFYAKWTQCTACATTGASCELSVVNNACTYTTTCNSGYGNIQNNGAYNATCTALPTYSITYVMDDGTNYSGAPITYTEGTGATIDGTPTKSGYVFAGWCTDSGLTTCAMTQTIGTTDTGDKTFYAKWTQCTACAATNASCELSVVNNACTYTTTCNSGYANIQNNGAYNASCSVAVISNIAYVLDGGTNYSGAPTEYIEGTGTTIDGTPTKSGYTFAGWCTDSGLTTCAATQTIDTNATGDKTFYAKWTVAKFSVTTTNLNANDTFQFTMSATGTFTVDCGADGVLSSSANDVTNDNTITRSNTTYATYTCTYSTGGVKTILFDGTATEYNSAIPYSNYYQSAPIAFYNSTSPYTNTKLSSISGDLSSLFPQLGSGLSNIPRFMQTFQGCTGLTSIPAGLFSGITTGAEDMFRGTFSGCTGLTSIPATLFSGITTGASNMFNGTFYGCTGLTSIPAGLFSGITTGADYMFYYTFYGCTGLTSIPATLFSGITTGAQYMFQNTFSNCTSLTSISAGLFSGITTGADYIFWETFRDCTGLTSIGDGLFSGITTGADSMFYSTFYGCTGLTSIPAGLFSGITTGAYYMFGNTFSGCTGLTSIPATLFSGITTGATRMFESTFYGCTGLTSISAGLFSGITTGADNMFSSTFAYCTKLTSIPAGLFSGITTGASNMFVGTFYGCTNLAGYIPPTTFAGLIANDSPTATNMWRDTFNNTNVATSCASYPGTTQYITGYEGTDYSNYTKWNGKVSCIETTPREMTLNTTNADTGVTPSTVYLSYNTGWYSDANGTTPITSLTTLPTKSGKIFGGFFTGENGTGTQIIYKDGNIVPGNLKFTIELTTLYAYFGDAYTVTYSCGDGTGTAPVSDTAVSGAPFTASGVGGCSKSGYGFAGWAVSNTNDVVAGSFTWNYAENKTLTAQWFESKFTVTTTNLSANDTFEWTMSATGTFTVDCGADGVLSSDANDVTNGNTITRSNTTYATYTCTYSTGGVKTISFDGTATGYNSYTNFSYNDHYKYSTISFRNNTKLSSISGDLSSIFPYKGSGTGQYPRFMETFNGCTGVTSIPAGLFSGITTGASYMFYYAFYGCTSLTSIPAGLFSGITTGADSMFYQTFRGCTGLTSIPATLFSGITTGAPNMFNSTFMGCTGLTSIPATLFSGITTGASVMFGGTFASCTGLTSIPSGLFSNITTGAQQMFSDTFSGCTGLTSIPAGLFSGITTGSTYMFYDTFYGCTNLSGYIPPTTFAGLIANEAPTATDMWYSTFTYTKVATSCASYPGTTQYITGYEGSNVSTTWSGKVSCIETTPREMTLNTTGADTGATPSTVYLSYNTGWYSDANGTTPITSLTTLPTKSGLVFAGFYTGENGTGTQMIASNGNFVDTKLTIDKTTLYAHFANGYNITYIMNDGTNYSGAPTAYPEGVGTTIDGVPTKNGHIFAGWCTDSTLETCAMTQTIGTSDTGDKTFYAKWTQCDACAATNASCELSVVNNVCTYTTACNTGYGNIQNSGAYNASCSANTYNISYEMDSGTNYNNAPTTYTYATGATIDGVPTKAGYTFAGWCTDSTLENCAMSQTISTTDFGDKTFYAKWTANTYTVSYVCGTGTSGTAPVSGTATYDASFTPAANTCTNGTMAFVGWTVDGTDDVVNGAFTWNYDDNKTLTAKWTKFAVTTTNLNANDTFRFTMSATGTFTVDCGEGGTLTSSANDVTNGNTITRSNTTYATYTCTYSTGGIKTISFDGTATGYNSNSGTYYQYATIAFYNNTKVASVSGNLSSVFPQRGSGLSNLPRFMDTFQGCTSLTSIPSGLFSGITTGATYMFYYTFGGCTGLTSIPSGLFSSITTGATNMFYGTFSGCTGLTSIPANLFSGITTGAYQMFNQTFRGCTGLTSIPATLFSGITTGSDYMFESTFSGCTGLTSIPAGLFSGITTSADGMFYRTFYGCSNLTGYIPPTTFAGLIANGSPNPSGMWLNAFVSTQLATSCPYGTVQYITGYEGYGSWYDKVSCISTTPMAITLDAGTGATAGSPSTVYLRYNTGWYSDAAGNNMIYQLTNIPTKSGYLFEGFYTGQNGTGTKLINENGDISYNNLGITTEPTTLYANFIPAHTVTYSCGAGTGTPPTANQAGYGLNYTVAQNTCTRNGYVFDGWTVSGTDDVWYEDNEFTWYYEGGKTFTARWIQSFTVTYSCGTGATGTAPEPEQAAYDYDFFPALPGGCAKNGYIFSGWAISGTDDVISFLNDDFDGIWHYNENKTLTAQWEEVKFTITAELTPGEEKSPDTTFSFGLAAAGAFLVDWGDGAIEPIYRADNTNYETYSHEYETDGVKNIKFTGTATGYPLYDSGPKGGGSRSFNQSTQTINFSNNSSIISVSGDMSKVFPYLGSRDGQYPEFYYAFHGCENLTSISGTLFSQYTNLNGAEAMFQNTFSETGLTSVPSGLFSNITQTTNATGMFYQTFYNCQDLTTIPGNLFSGITTGARSMFEETFANCTSLTSIPAGLFSGITQTANATGMFYQTFYNCQDLTTIPGNLFSGITTGAENMFAETFAYTGLTSIPSGLFSSITTGADSMFSYTFSGCTGLTSIPAELFSGITNSAENMFAGTFYGCTNLSGYIPPSTFAGLVANGSPKSYWMWNETFYNTQVATSCDNYPGMTQFFTGYEGEDVAPKGMRGSSDDYQTWSGQVSCQPTSALTITLDDDNANTSVVPDTAYMMFNDDWYSDANTTSTISVLTTVPAKTGKVFNGFWSGRNGTGTQIIDKNGDFVTDTSALIFTSSNTTAYADWRTPYTVTYSCGTGASGTAPASTTALYGSNFTPAENTNCAKANHVFMGWSVSGTNDVVNNEFVWNYTQNKTLTANWLEAKFSVTTIDLSEIEEEAPPLASTRGLTKGATKGVSGEVDVDFGFYLSAAGVFTVSWGDGTIETIDRTDNTQMEYYSHNYTTGGAKTIAFNGVATGYYDGNSNNNNNEDENQRGLKSAPLEKYEPYPTIFFGTQESINNIYNDPETNPMIASVAGDMSTIFPYFGLNRGQYPEFFRTFAGCENLTTVPGTLFSGYTDLSGARGMFMDMFTGCESLTTIPAGLFSGITTGAVEMFSGTFAETGLTAIPSGLFSGITRGAAFMFNNTFSSCPDLTNVPSGLFGNIRTGAEGMFEGTFQDCESLTTIPGNLFNRLVTSAPNMFYYTFAETGLTTIPSGLFNGITTGAEGMFEGTFNDCTSLSTIPSGLFSNITTGADNMFNNTFNSTAITSIPANLFSGLRTSADYMFLYTFSNCQSLTSIPAELFSSITTSAEGMFSNTFEGCENLSGYIPPTTFAGLIANGSPKSDWMWSNTFNGTNVATNCNDYPGTTQYITGYENADQPLANTGMRGSGDNYRTWSDQVSCIELSPVEITLSATGATTGVSPSTLYYLVSDDEWYSDSGAITAINNLSSLPTKTGYAFDGFYTGQNGTGIRVIDNDGEFIGNTHFTLTNTTLYANFIPEYTIIYSCGTGATGSAPEPETVLAGDEFTTAMATGCSKTGHTFAGWAVSDTNDVYTEQDSFTWRYTDNKTLTAQWIEPQFTVTTTNLESGDEFVFGMSAAGVFVVDWGDGAVEIINRTNNTEYDTYSHEYETGGIKTIKFAGVATGYPVLSMNDDPYPAIDFNGEQWFGNTTGHMIASVSGSLGALFPQLGNGTTQKPAFFATFAGCENLTSIPSTLFSGLTGGLGMFSDTFSNCTGLTSIPAGLFSGITTGAENMFSFTFYGCTGLTSIPATLFSGITTGANSMFENTFFGCNGLTSIPATLFSGITTGAEGMFAGTFNSCYGLTSIPATLFSGITTGAEGMFASTFNGCTSLTSIPAGLFSGITTGAEGMFASTFSGCTGLTTIPATLFSGITTGANNMFYQTFYGCTGLTSIPATLFSGITTGAVGMFNSTFNSCDGLTSIPSELFSGITTGADWMFWNTFYGCTNLTGYIPPTTFAGLIANGSPTESDMWADTFTNTNVATSCNDYPGTTQYITGYEGSGNTTWNGKVSCQPTSLITITLNDSNATTSVAPGTVYLDFGNGWYSDSSAETSITALSTVPTKSGYAFNGFWSGQNGTGTQIIDKNGDFIDTYSVLRFTETNAPAYADWRTQYTVTYSCGAGVSGTAPEGTTALSGMSFSTGFLGKDNCDKDGYEFMGWGVSGTDDILQPGDTFTWNYTENKTLTAQWAQIYNVTYSCGTGTGNAPAIDETAPGSMFEPAWPDDCSKNGYMFSGWTVSGTNDVVNVPFTWNYNEDKTLTAQWVEPKFSVTTTELESGDEFAFGMSAAGVFVVDWGDGAVEIIDRTNNTEYDTYSHEYETSGVKTIKFTGTATGYYPMSMNDEAYPAIDFDGDGWFGNATGHLVASVSGSLGALFPQLGNGASQKPAFTATFAWCQNLTSIPSTLFSGLTGGLGMFASTFNGCDGLTSIPAGLFSGITTGAEGMFAYTFDGCNGLISIPATLFSGITTGAEGMFTGTFEGCNGLTSIPARLFSGITTGADYMFAHTFSGCTGLTSIPATLFSGITTGAEGMFASTFGNCGSLSGYVPSTLFTGLIENGSPNPSMMDGIFNGTNLDTSCDGNSMEQYFTGYEDYWDSKVSCINRGANSCDEGQYLPRGMDQCAICPENNFCEGGNYYYNENYAQGAVACPDNQYAPAGSASVDDCGHILHVGDAYMYLGGVKKTVPSLNVRVNNEVFYGNTTTDDVVMNINTDKKLKVNYNNTTYSVYDNTVSTEEPEPPLLPQE